MLCYGNTFLRLFFFFPPHSIAFLLLSGRTCGIAGLGQQSCTAVDPAAHTGLSLPPLQVISSALSPISHHQVSYTRLNLAGGQTPAPVLRSLHSRWPLAHVPVALVTSPGSSLAGKNRAESPAPCLTELPAPSPPRDNSTASVTHRQKKDLLQNKPLWLKYSLLVEDTFLPQPDF